MVSSSVICGSSGRSNIAEPPPEIRKKIRVSFFALRSSASVARAAANDPHWAAGARPQNSGSASCASSAILVRAADAAQALAPLHPLQQRVEHRRRRLAQRDHKDALVAGQVDRLRPAAVGQQPLQLVALKA